MGYSSLETTIVQETSKNSLSLLVANIGGQMGLWMGISVVTVLQTLLYCLGATLKRLCGTYEDKIDA